MWTPQVELPLQFRWLLARSSSVGRLPGSGSDGWAEGWRVGGAEAEPQHMVAVCLLGSRAGLMGQPAGHGEAALGRPSLRPACPNSAGPPGPGALLGSLPPPTPPASLRWGCGPALSRHLEMPGPGERGWPILPSILGGVPARCGRPSREEDTWPAATFALPQAGLQRGPARWPRSPQPPQSLISPPSEQLVLPGKLPNESTMWGLWRQKGWKQASPRTRPTGRGGTVPAGSLHPSPTRRRLPPAPCGLKKSGVKQTWVPLPVYPLPTVWPYEGHFI